MLKDIVLYHLGYGDESSALARLEYVFFQLQNQSVKGIKGEKKSFQGWEKTFSLFQPFLVASIASTVYILFPGFFMALNNIKRFLLDSPG